VPGSDRHDWQWRSAFLGSAALAALPVLPAVLAHRLWIRRKGLTGLAGKLTGCTGWTRRGDVVVHGVSLGETALMAPLLPELEAVFGRPCSLTTTTETGWAALAQRFPERQRAFLPLDLPWAVERFLSETRPSLLVLLELELWPGLLAACHRRGIPVAILNARITERSFRGYRHAVTALGPLLDPVIVCAQNPTWAARLRALGCRRVAVTGSMKADMVRLTDAGTAAAMAQRLALAGTPLLLAASTSGDEEMLVVQAWQEAGLRAAGWRLVLAPRHPERGPLLAEALRRHGLEPWLASRDDAPAPAGSVPIIDETGRLSALYACAAASDGIAIVGGSLGSRRHGQNMLEPAAAGACTVVGDDTSNFPDAMALLREAGGIAECAPAGLAALLRELAGDAGRRRALGVAGRAAWAGNRGATARTVAALQRLLALTATDPSISAEVTP
jgi:3-deoxy-D-manno-octulosonic-acid transferase